ncbi:MAG: hypothetical protein H8E66_19665 [Planctomycetes bacterium]|nr:hypothetical protein [Planctomycetota bacterium]
MNKHVLFLLSMAGVFHASFARAQVVQLPTFHSFSVSTTVSVPDRGAAYLGGVTRGAWSSSSRGVPGLSHVPGLNRLFANRGIGSSVSSSHAYATATIIDHSEMDRALLSRAAARRGELGVASETDRRAGYLSTFVAKRPKSETPRTAVIPNRSTTDLKTRIADASARNAVEMETYLERAKRAETAGRLGAARCCYNVLVRRGNNSQKQYAALRLVALEAPRTTDSLASRDH